MQKYTEWLSGRTGPLKFSNLLGISILSVDLLALALLIGIPALQAMLRGLPLTGIIHWQGKHGRIVSAPMLSLLCISAILGIASAMVLISCIAYRRGLLDKYKG